MLLFRDKTRWNLDFSDQAVYRDFINATIWSLPSLTVYAVTDDCASPVGRIQTSQTNSLTGIGRVPLRQN
jgi:hypothetical protein